jgi:N-carbamoyl-L-amino-acid hydrolase
MNGENLRINAQRLRAALEEMAKIGTTAGGGVQRLALSDEDKQARDLFVEWLNEIDLQVMIDEMGNIFGKRAGRNNNLPPVMIGSHMDSQPKGGRFDGILGVMGALEVMRTINENGVDTDRPILIVDWTNEEGTRFDPAMLGSGVWTGKLDKDWVYGRFVMHGKGFG